MRYISTIERQGIEKGIKLSQSLIRRFLERQVGESSKELS